MEQEEWRPIPGYPGYEASSLGRIRSWRRGDPRVMKPSVSKFNYERVRLSLGGNHAYAYESVHRLVCLTFHGRPDPDMQAAHEDGNRRNNRADNLSWKTAKENAADRVRHGTNAIGVRNPRHVLSETQVRAIRTAHRRGIGYPLLSDLTGVRVSTVKRIVTGRLWKHVEDEPDEAVA